MTYPRTCLTLAGYLLYIQLKKKQNKKVLLRWEESGTGGGWRREGWEGGSMYRPPSGTDQSTGQLPAEGWAQLGTEGHGGSKWPLVSVGGVGTIQAPGQGLVHEWQWSPWQRASLRWCGLCGTGTSSYCAVDARVNDTEWTGSTPFLEGYGTVPGLREGECQNIIYDTWSRLTWVWDGSNCIPLTQIKWMLCNVHPSWEFRVKVWVGS